MGSTKIGNGVMNTMEKLQNCKSPSSSPAILTEAAEIFFLETDCARRNSELASSH
jgi:hypothetical protein